MCIRDSTTNHPLYFYFRFIWPNDLESGLRVVLCTYKIFTQFEVDTTICYQLDTLGDLGTLTFDLFDLWRWKLVTYHVSRDHACTKFELPIYSYVQLYTTFWPKSDKCCYSSCAFCACAVPRNQFVGVNIAHIFAILFIHFATNITWGCDEN